MIFCTQTTANSHRYASATERVKINELKINTKLLCIRADVVRYVHCSVSFNTSRSFCHFTIMCISLSLYLWTKTVHLLAHTDYIPCTNLHTTRLADAPHNADIIVGLARVRTLTHTHTCMHTHGRPGCVTL